MTIDPAVALLGLILPNEQESALCAFQEFKLLDKQQPTVF
jgi:hypothetical protein